MREKGNKRKNIYKFDAFFIIFPHYYSSNMTNQAHTHTKLPTNFSYFSVDNFKLLALNFFMYTNKYLAYNMCTKRKANRVMTRWSLFPLLAFVFVCFGFGFAMYHVMRVVLYGLRSKKEAEISVKSGSGKKRVKINKKRE